MKTKLVSLGSLALSIFLTAAQPVFAQDNTLKFRCANIADNNEPQTVIKIGEQQLVWGTELYQNLKQTNSSDQRTRSYIGFSPRDLRTRSDITYSENYSVAAIELKMLQGLPGNLRYTIEEKGTKKILAEFRYVCIRDLSWLSSF